MSEQDLINTSTVPVDLTGGRVLAPGEQAHGVDIGEHEEALIAGGRLTVLDHDHDHDHDSDGVPADGPAPEAADEPADDDEGRQAPKTTRRIPRQKERP